MTLDSEIIFTKPLIGLLTGALAGVLPAIRAARTPPDMTLKNLIRRRRPSCGIVSRVA